MPTLALDRQDSTILYDLLDAHRRLPDQTLSLAALYRPTDKPDDLVLFEVLQGFGGDETSAEGSFLKAWVAPSPAFRLRSAQDFYLLLTNPVEFDEALERSWPQIEEVRRSVDRGEAVRLYADPSGEGLWRRLGGQ